MNRRGWLLYVLVLFLVGAAWGALCDLEGWSRLGTYVGCVCLAAVVFGLWGRPAVRWQSVLAEVQCSRCGKKTLKGYPLCDTCEDDI
jgi:hypothetical protein